jgi:hypothetical protein
MVVDMRNFWESRSIFCVLTQRNVTTDAEIIQVTGIGGQQAIGEGRKSCRAVDLSVCPGNCVYISGGTGFGVDPETGRPINVSNL